MSRAPISFPDAPPSIDDADLLEQEEIKLRNRAEKFGLPYQKGELMRAKFGMVRDDARQALRTRRDVIPTGFDMFSEEELARRRARAAKFGTGDVEASVRIAQPSEEEVKRRERAAKYGLPYSEKPPVGGDGGTVLEARAEAPEAAEARPDALHVYGVDLLSTADILRYFEAYAATVVEWINDSSCNVAFADGHAATRALVGLGEALPPEDASASLDGMSASDIVQLKHVWYRGRTAVSKAGVAVPLMFRVATTADVKGYLEQRRSRYLWQMPVRQALAAAQSGAKAVPLGRQRRKRARADAEGDAVMVEADGERQPRGRGRKQGRHQQQQRPQDEEGGGGEGDEDDAAVGTGRAKREPATTSFLDDEARGLGARSFFLNEGRVDGDDDDSMQEDVVEGAGGGD